MEVTDAEPASEVPFLDGIFPTLGEFINVWDGMGFEMGDEVRLPRVTPYVQCPIRARKRLMDVAVPLTGIWKATERTSCTAGCILDWPFGHATVPRLMLFHVSFPSVAGGNHSRIRAYEAPMAMASGNGPYCFIS